jgi:hypothetical protein
VGQVLERVEGPGLDLAADLLQAGVGHRGGPDPVAVEVADLMLTQDGQSDADEVQLRRLAAKDADRDLVLEIPALAVGVGAPALATTAALGDLVRSNDTSHESVGSIADPPLVQFLEKLKLRSHPPVCIPTLKTIRVFAGSHTSVVLCTPL